MAQDNSGGGFPRHIMTRNSAAIEALNGETVRTKEDLGTLSGDTRSVPAGRYFINADINLGFEQLLITGDVEFIGPAKISSNATTTVGPMVLVTGGSLKCRGITFHNTNSGTGGIKTLHVTGSNDIELDLIDTHFLLGTDGNVVGSVGVDIASTAVNLVKMRGCTAEGNQAFSSTAGSANRLEISHTTFNSRAVTGGRCVVMSGATVTYATFMQCTFNLGQYTFNIAAGTYTNPVRIIGCNLIGYTTGAFVGLDQTSSDVETLANNGVADG